MHNPFNLSAKTQALLVAAKAEIEAELIAGEGQIDIYFIITEAKFDELDIKLAAASLMALDQEIAAG